ncbi:MAG: CDP-diacylglycerol--serine O-phosphatidyltransferase [Flavobacteriales bacterium]|nr:CDP-diacylglycerol--serine O-phosphatidyltransferase [Flavobacteriales bacterium]
MNSIKRNIPNLITLGNLFCGLVAIVSSLNNNLYFAGTFIFFGAILDFFDGLSARLLKVSSEIGKHLDSMADMVTFGVAPGMIMFQMIKLSNIDENAYIAYIGFIITIFSAIRLAKFNIDTKQTSSFIGLPTPAAAIFIASLPIISKHNITIQFNDSTFLIVTSIILSLLLLAKLSLFSLKIKKGEDWKNKENIIRIIFLISCVILLFGFEFAVIPFIVILYIFLSILNNLIK